MQLGLWAQITRFGTVGGVGFVVDGGLLWSLLTIGLDPYLARLLSFPVAVVVTWALNRNWTFQGTRDARKRHREFGRYFGVQIVGTLTNYSLYSLIISAFGTVGLTIFWAFALGSFVGSSINFIGARHLAFRE